MNKLIKDSFQTNDIQDESDTSQTCVLIKMQKKKIKSILIRKVHQIRRVNVSVKCQENKSNIT